MDGLWKENRINGRRLKKRLTAPHLAAAGFKAHAQNSIKRGNHRLKSGIRLWLELLKGENCQPRHLSLLRSGPCLGTNPKSRPTKRYIARHPTEYSRSKFELSALTTNFNTFGTIYKQTTGAHRTSLNFA